MLAAGDAGGTAASAPPGQAPSRALAGNVAAELRGLVEALPGDLVTYRDEDPAARVMTTYLQMVVLLRGQRRD